MRIGFIGAGKVGTTLGKYISQKRDDIVGYYSRHKESADFAATFTNTKSFYDLQELVNESDVVIITVPDDKIKQVWNDIKQLDIKGKLICHCSGAMTSKVFSGAAQAGAYAYSIHPIFAINSKTESYKKITEAFFTVEGDHEFTEKIQNFIKNYGNPCVIISSQHKTKYHGAAVFASNLVVGLMKAATDLLVEVGFNEEDAEKALIPLFTGNAQNIVTGGLTKALTGPIERNDVETVKKHMETLEDNFSDVYVSLSKEVLKIAKDKNKSRDYGEMEKLLEEKK